MGGKSSKHQVSTIHNETLSSNETKVLLTCRKCKREWTLSKADIDNIVKDHRQSGYRNCECKNSSLPMKVLKDAGKALSQGKTYKKADKNLYLKTVKHSGNKVSPGGDKRTQKQKDKHSQSGNKVSPGGDKRTQKQKDKHSQNGNHVPPGGDKRTQKQKDKHSQSGNKISPADGSQTSKEIDNDPQLFTITLNNPVEKRRQESNIYNVQSSDITSHSTEPPNPKTVQMHIKQQKSLSTNSSYKQNLTEDRVTDLLTTARHDVNPVRMLVKGIPNVGQSCYANAVLQILNQTLCDHDWNTLTSSRSSSLAGNADSFRTPAPNTSAIRNCSTISEVLQKFLCEMNDPNIGLTCVRRSTVQELMEMFCQRDRSFSWGLQNDSHSFLLSLFSMIKDEGRGRLYPMFEAKTRNEFHYESCNHVEYSEKETSLGFLIPIEYDKSNWTVEKGLNILLGKEYFPETILCCRTCVPSNSKQVKKNSKTSKQLIILDPPDIMVLHLGRFREVPGRQFSKISKINNKVGYDAILSLPISGDKSVRYELYAVVLHTGSITGGHYTSFVRKPLPSAHGYAWYHCDDSTTSQIDDRKAINSPDAYLLFYSKLST